MRILEFHSLRGEKSALMLIKDSFAFSSTPVYIPRTAVTDMKAGDTIPFPKGYKTAPIVDVETGEVRTAENGNALLQLVPE